MLTLTLQAAIDADPAVPLILVHELDPRRGGASLEELQAECPDDLRGDVFIGAEQECTCTMYTAYVHMHMVCAHGVHTQSTGWDCNVLSPATYSLPEHTEQEGAVVPQS